MKSLFAAVSAVLLLTLLATAQNVSTVTETGNNNGAWVNQTWTGPGPVNTATITQTGNLNHADVIEPVYMTIFSQAKGVTQKGVGNTGSITQSNLGGVINVGAMAGMAQLSNGNTATITQVGGGPNAWVQQYAWIQQFGGNNNTASQYQTGNATSHIWQQGGGNGATAIQLAGYGFRADAFQYGDHNSSYQWQDGGGFNNNLKALATQYGVGNGSDQQQVGNSNQTTVYQNGSGNHAWQSQLGGTPPPANLANNMLLAEQHGMNQESRQSQTVGGPSGKGLMNMGSVYQEGVLNIAWQYQDGSRNMANTSQYTDGNLSKVWQHGDANEFTSTQYGGVQNIVNLDQTNGSRAVIEQHGSHNVVDGINDWLSISHDASIMTVMQDGNSNTLHHYQLNSENSTVGQFGNFNTATVIQQ